MKAPESDAIAVVSALSGYSRLAQWLGWLANSVSGSTARPLDELRVSREEYGANLEAIVARFAGRGIPVALITAPAAHRRLGVPDYLIDHQFARDKDSVIALHDEYNSKVREVASSGPAILMDLAVELGALSTRQLASVFMQDGIHFTSAGLALIATRVADEISRELEGRDAQPADGGPARGIGATR